MHTLSFLPGVRYWDWSTRKSDVLRRSGRPAFEDVMAAIRSGGFRGTEDSRRYPGQRIMFVMIDGYAHAVPFRVIGDTGILITVYPSRVLQRRFGKASK